MKKIILLLLLCIGINAVIKAQTYASPALKQATSKHKLVAILPCESKISYKIADRRLNLELNATYEADLKQTVQSSLFNFLLERSDKNTVEFQDIDKTNLMLEKAGVLHTLHQLSKEEIARILDVDAIISGKYEIEHRNRIDGNRIGSAGSKPSDKKTTELPEITGIAVTTIALHDGSNGSLLWRYSGSVNDYAYSTQLLVDDLMKKTAKNFPYNNKNK